MPAKRKRCNTGENLNSECNAKLEEARVSSKNGSVTRNPNKRSASGTQMNIISQNQNNIVTKIKPSSKFAKK